MQRREFIAAAGTAAALASASKAFAQAAGGGEMEEPMHPPKYKALEESAAKCVATGNDCLRHCLGMYKMKDEHVGLRRYSLPARRCLQRAGGTGGGQFGTYRPF